jgi:PEGA domain
MQFLRVGIAVLVAFMLGIGVGLVGGVYVSVHEFAAPVKPAIAESSASPSPAREAKEPTASPSTTPGSSASAAASPSPSPTASASPKAVATTPHDEPSPDASATATPAHEVAKEPQQQAEPSPSSSPTEEPSPDKPKKATLRVTANKGNGFKVLVDGESKGVTPMAVEVSPGKPHTVKVVGGDKYKSWIGKATAQAGEIEDVQAELTFIEAPAPVAAPAPVYHAPAYHAPAYRPRPSYNPPARYYPPSGGGAPSITGTHKM